MKGSTAALLVVLLFIFVLLIISVIIYSNNRKKEEAENENEEEAEKPRSRYEQPGTGGAAKTNAPQQGPSSALTPDDWMTSESFRPLTDTVGDWSKPKGDVRITDFADKVFLRGVGSSVILNFPWQEKFRGKLVKDGEMYVLVQWSNQVTFSMETNKEPISINTLNAKLKPLDENLLKERQHLKQWNVVPVPVRFSTSQDVEIKITITQSSTGAKLYVHNHTIGVSTK